ncbi:RodZ domain-containing protein [Virgibacillus byunsanensis]|uniref:RodZ domain-containing protein n=1 Tax=Virgibacillus byunsanensis TaxID=570945 RepID=A0ABW3LKU2_9BACI
MLEEGTGPNQNPTYELNNPDDELVFTFEAGNDVWLDVENGDGESFYGAILTSEESPMELDLTGQERVYFNVGSTPNLQITVNGIELEYPVDPNESDVQRFWININQTSE